MANLDDIFGDDEDSPAPRKVPNPVQTARDNIRNRRSANPPEAVEAMQEDLDDLGDSDEAEKPEKIEGRGRPRPVPKRRSTPPVESREADTETAPPPPEMKTLEQQLQALKAYCKAAGLAAEIKVTL